jgi:hypothetical protein
MLAAERLQKGMLTCLDPAGGVITFYVEKTME